MKTQYVESFRKGASKADYERDKNLKPLENIEIFKDIKYGNGRKYNLLDIYYPKGTKNPLPVIVSVHGGGFVYGYKEAYFHYCLFLASQGFVVVNFNYHLAPEKKFPTQLEDINKVFVWMKENKDKYYMDLNNIFVVGDSAGGQLASHYLTIYSNPKFARLFNFEVPHEVVIRACGLNCGLYDTSDAYPRINTRVTIKHVPRAIKRYDTYLGRKRNSIYEMTQPLMYMDSNFPPAFLLSSYYDFLKDNCQPMSEYLNSLGVDSVYKIYGNKSQEYMSHVFHVNMNLKEAKEANLDQIAFFRKHMQK